MAIRGDIIERANARLGSVLKGKWRLDAVIGIGGMASVYAATHRNQARVAIKLLHAEVALDAEVTARFLREGYVANAVGHPGTVKVLDDDISEDQAPFLVMELLVGQTLDTMLAMEPDGLSAREVLPLLDQLLDVLSAAHEKGIVHRDLKPENLFLTSDGRLKVLDFGIARLRELSVQSATATQAGSVLGTPAFMAPEQALGRWSEVDGRTDIWAVGATAFTLLTGAYVHEAQTLQEQLVLSATRSARGVREVSPMVPQELARVVDRALSFSRTDRFADARAMREALHRARAALLGESFSPVSPRFTDSARASSHDDQHGATLVAPLEVTSAITGREASATTGPPVTRQTVVSGAGVNGKPRRKAPLAALLGALLASSVLLAFMRLRGESNIDVGASRTSMTRASSSTQANVSAATPPAVAPILVPTSPATASASAVSVVKPLAVSHWAARPALTPEKPHVGSVKALINPDNPFDRRH